MCQSAESGGYFYVESFFIILMREYIQILFQNSFVMKFHMFLWLCLLNTLLVKFLCLLFILYLKLLIYKIMIADQNYICTIFYI